MSAFQAHMHSRGFGNYRHQAPQASAAANAAPGGAPNGSAQQPPAAGPSQPNPAGAPFAPPSAAAYGFQQFMQNTAMQNGGAMGPIPMAPPAMPPHRPAAGPTVTYSPNDLSIYAAHHVQPDNILLQPQQDPALDAQRRNLLQMHMMNSFNLCSKMGSLSPTS